MIELKVLSLKVQGFVRGKGKGRGNVEGGSREGEGYKIRKGRGGYELKRVGIGKVKDKEILICCMIYSIQLNLVNKHLFYFYPSILLSFYLSILLSFYPAIL